MSWFIAAFAINLNRSLVAWHHDRPVGFLLFGSRGLAIRGAAMGIVPDWRGMGVGTLLMEQGVQQSRDAGFTIMKLEVFSENQSAIAIYRKCGFEIRQLLLGFEQDAVETSTSEKSNTRTLSEIDPQFLARQLAPHIDDSLPWQCSPGYFARFSPPSRAYNLDGKAFALVTARGDNAMNINALFVDPESRRQGWGSSMLHSLFNRFPEKKWIVIPVVPKGLMDGFFHANGFQTSQLHQLHMELQLT